MSAHTLIHPPERPLIGAKAKVRLPEPHDIDALVSYGDDPDVAETIWIPIPTPCSRNEAQERLEEFKRGWNRESCFGPTLLVSDRENDEMIGVVFLREREQDTVELSYGVAANRRNRGIATDAVALVSRWCLDDLSARQIELRIGQTNFASQRVAAKAGFHYEGIVHSKLAATGESYDDVLYTLA